MNASLCFTPSVSPLTPKKIISTQTAPLVFQTNLQIKLHTRCAAIKAVPSETADYSSTTSVFPAEACDTIGGEACNVEMYPETKLKPEVSNKSSNTTEQVDREYLEYSDPKTVFPGEACDDLGGEFCQPDYRKGVY